MRKAAMTSSPTHTHIRAMVGLSAAADEGSEHGEGNTPGGATAPHPGDV